MLEPPTIFVFQAHEQFIIKINNNPDSEWIMIN
jgi:hypothetical protein